MATFENGTFIQFTEYEQGISRRVQEADLSVGALYMAMLRGVSSDRFAAKLPARLEQVRKESGLAIARVAFLDSKDLKPELERDITFADGLFEEIHGSMSVVATVGGDNRRFDVGEGYFLDYDDGMGGSSLRLWQELERSYPIDQAPMRHPSSARM